METAEMSAQELVDLLVKRNQSLEEQLIIVVNQPTRNEAKKIKGLYTVQDPVVRAKLENIRNAEGRLSMRIISKYKSAKEDSSVPVPETTEEATVASSEPALDLFDDEPAPELVHEADEVRY